MNNHNEIYVLCQNYEIKKDTFFKLLKYISKEKRDILIKQNYEIAKKSLFGELLIRYILYNKLKMKNSDLIFGFSEFGKPFLKNIDSFHFNISHSGRWIICGVDDKPIGVDVEVLRKFDFKIAKRFFTKFEFDYIANSPIKKQINKFYEIWTTKESYIKAIGGELFFTFFLNKLQGITDQINIKNTRYYFTKITFKNEAICTICSAKTKNKIIHINQKNIIKQVLNIFDEVEAENEI